MQLTCKCHFWSHQLHAFLRGCALRTLPYAAAAPSSVDACLVLTRESCDTADQLAHLRRERADLRLVLRPLHRRRHAVHLLPYHQPDHRGDGRRRRRPPRQRRRSQLACRNVVLGLIGNGSNLLNPTRHFGATSTEESCFATISHIRTTLHQLRLVNFVVGLMPACRARRRSRRRPGGVRGRAARAMPRRRAGQRDRGVGRRAAGPTRAVGHCQHRMGTHYQLARLLAGEGERMTLAKLSSLQ